MTLPDRPAQPPDSAPDEAEVARLRAEVARLKAEQAQPASVDRGGWWRPVVVTILVFIAALLAPLSVLATWAQGQIQDTDQYLQTVTPLADDPAVQDAMAARIEQVVFSYLDVNAALDELVTAIEGTGISAPAAATLNAAVGPLSSGIENFVSDRIHQFVQSDAFKEAWVAANRAAHDELVKALTGQGKTVTVKNGEVTVGLATFIEAVKTQLVDAGFGLAARIPTVDATFTIVQSGDLSKVQRLLGVLDNLSTWLPVIGLGLIGVAVAIARDRRRALFAAGLAVAGSMLLLGAALNVLRPIYLDALPASSSPAAAGAVYDQLVSFIRFALRGVLVLGLAVAVGAWLSAPRGTGAATRAGLVHGIDAVRRGGLRAGLNTGRLGVFLARYRAAVRTVIIAAAALWYLSLDHPTGSTALTFVISVVVLLLLAELLAAGPATDAETQDHPAGSRTGT